MWIIWDGRMLNYGLAGRSQNVLFNLYLIATNIEYKKINIFYNDPLPDLRPDLETSGYSAIAYTVFLAATKSRTLELLAFDEYCRFDTSAFFSYCRVDRN